MSDSTAETTWCGPENLARLTLPELEAAISDVDPAAMLILPRILRRVIKHKCDLGGFGLRVPHRKSFVIAAEPLLDIVEKSELGLPDEAELPPTVFLLARPSQQRLLDTPAGVMLLRYWRLLYHLKIHATYEQLQSQGRLSDKTIQDRILKLGEAEFDEIRLVLSQDDMLLPPADDTTVYIEFAAFFLELWHFSRNALRRFFPGLRNVDAVRSLILQDIDDERLFSSSRPTGASTPKDESILAELETEIEPEGDMSVVQEPITESSLHKYRMFLRQARRPASLGNVVRSAICHTKAKRYAPADMSDQAEIAIRKDVDRLIQRLQTALGIPDSSPRSWRDAIFALVAQTPYGIWPAEARLLYDLQKVCVDYERGIYTVDVVEWVLSRGQRPIKRPLPNQRDVLMLKHLRSAVKRLAVVRLSVNDRRQLAVLLQEATERVEIRVRDSLRPQIVVAFDAVGLRPHNLPERVARKKMIEELLDFIVERGYLSMGGLRDAISRNNLKLPDLEEPLDLLRGDPLLKTDRKLATLLDGVYRRGEFYLRWMQRLSSVAFGTSIGRFFTRYGVVPFGGAYVALAGIHHVYEMFKHPAAETTTKPLHHFAPSASQPLHLTSPEVVLGVGFVLLLLVNSSSFRSFVATLFKSTFRIFHTIAIEPIRWIWHSAFLQRIIKSKPFSLAMRFGVKPLLGTILALKIIPIDESNIHVSAGLGVALFLTVNMLMNSRVGQTLEEITIDAIVQGWHQFGLRAITGLFWIIIEFFRAILEKTERLMYAVDEWLRFRGDERKAATITKAVLGVLWFYVAYVLRFAVNVLIEPQINPIKHFPVVTVSHKLLLPVIPPFAGVLEMTLDRPLAYLVAVSIIWSIPGIFGFLVWELKENWRLYAANRRRNLSPVLIGSHGETMGRLLKPGFHSGTLPKRFAKLRRAERHAWFDGKWAATRKQVQLLRHAEVFIRRFLERDFVEYFAESRAWQAPPVQIEDLRVATNAVQIGIACPGVAAGLVRIAITVEGGWLTADIVSPSWLGQLSLEHRQVFTTVLLGFYKAAGIELVHQQIADVLSTYTRQVNSGTGSESNNWSAEGRKNGQTSPMAGSISKHTSLGHLAQFQIKPDAIILWPTADRHDVEVSYSLQEGFWISPQTIRGRAASALPTIERSRLLFSETPISWDAWVMTWNQDTAGLAQRLPIAGDIRILPG